MPSPTSPDETAPAPRGPLGAVLAALPTGGSLSREDLRVRHVWICRLLWMHVLVVPTFGILRGVGPGHALLEGGVLIGVLALLASTRRPDDALRSLAATLGLVVSSTVLVHFSGGLIEMHVHFIVAVIVVSFYQSWRPFLVALGVVFLHHGIAGTLDPASVYNHPAALARPWLWALIHSGMILAASMACLVSWRLDEDVLDRERWAHDELAAAQRLTATGSWDWDQRNDELSWSAELHRLLQVDPSVDPPLTLFLERVHPGDRDRVSALLQSARQTTGHLDFECRILLPDGTTRTICTLGTHVAARHGPTVRMQGSCQDITERRALEAEIEYRAFHDGLTGLANRSLFMDRLEHALVARDRSNITTTVLYADLDGFKAVNDRHGHHAGDQLLVEAARRLRRCARDSDTLARLGGDEFGMILPEATVDEARKIAERIHRELAVPLMVGDEPQRIALSIGIAQATGQGCDELLREADTAMYAAKAAGKGRHETYVPGIMAGTIRTPALPTA